MKLFDKLNEVLGFTPAELKVILVLIGSFVLGWGLKWYKASHDRGPVYNYAAVDSEFAARSAAYANARRDSSRAITSAKGAEKDRHPRSKVNINTATKDELIGLPGIGAATAERIILYREDHGPFTSVSGLEGVKGIGKKKLQRLVPFCTTEK